MRFEVDDLELDWTYRADDFDFIHSRNIAQSIKDWPRYVSQMFTFVPPPTSSSPAATFGSPVH